MGARQDDLSSSGAARDVGDVGAHAVSVAVALTGHLLMGRHDALVLLIQTHVDDTGVAPLLHGAGDQLAGLVLEGAQDLEVAAVLDALDDDTAGRGLGDAAEVVGGVVEVLPRGLVLLVDLRGQDAHVPGATVDLDVGAANGPRNLGVGPQDGVLDSGQQVVQVNTELVGSASQLRHIDVHGSLGPLWSAERVCTGFPSTVARDGSDGPSRLSGPVRQPISYQDTHYSRSLSAGSILWIFGLLPGSRARPPPSAPR